MSSELCAIHDGDRYFFVNVATGGYGIGLSDDREIDGTYLAALLNSRLLGWAIARYARAFRGAFQGARAGTLRRLPIAIPGLDEQRRVVQLANDCREAATQLDSAIADHDREALARIYETAVRTFDAAVAQLYGVTAEELVLTH
jgi:hypothetical protein